MEKLIGDMYLAAALLAYDADMERIDRSDNRRQKFVFTGEVKEIYVMEGNFPIRKINPSLDDIEMAFVGHKLMFPATYPDALRRIKSAIHANE